MVGLAGAVVLLFQHHSAWVTPARTSPIASSGATRSPHTAQWTMWGRSRRRRDRSSCAQIRRWRRTVGTVTLRDVIVTPCLGNTSSRR